jgi:hypothetical protein
MENKRPRDRIRQRALGCRLKKVGAVQCSACVRPPADTAAVCGAAPCAYVLPAPTQRERRGGRGRAAWPRLALPRLRPSSPSPSQPRARARALSPQRLSREDAPVNPPGRFAPRDPFGCVPPRAARHVTRRPAGLGVRAYAARIGVAGTRQRARLGGRGGGAPAGVARTYERTARPTDRPLARPRNERRF